MDDQRIGNDSQMRIDRGVEAKRIIQSPVFNEAFERFLNEIHRLRLSIPPRDTEGAMRLVQMEQTVVKAKQSFIAFIQDGDLAARELKEQEQPGILGRTARRFRQVV